METTLAPATAQLVVALAEFDRRRLYLPAGCASLFTYCTQVLRLSEHAAYHRIQAARAARRVPEILDRIAAGDLTLTAVTLLAPHMTAANGPELLEAARWFGPETLSACVRERPPAAHLLDAIRTDTNSGRTRSGPSWMRDASGSVPDCTKRRGGRQLHGASRLFRCDRVSEVFDRRPIFRPRREA